MSTAENLEKAFALFGPNGETWIRGVVERWLESNNIDTCYCAIGALNQATAGNPYGPQTRASFLSDGVITWDTYRDTPEVQALVDAMREQLDDDLLANYDWDYPANAIAEFNDSRDNFDQVREWWNRAVEIARERA